MELVGMKMHTWQPAAFRQHSRCLSGATKRDLTSIEFFTYRCIKDYSIRWQALKKIGMVVLVQTKEGSSVWADTGILSPTLTMRWRRPSGIVVENSGLVNVYFLVI